MNYKIIYNIKVYGKGAIIYPTEIYAPKSINQARTMFNVMKKLDPYIGCRIEVVESVCYANGHVESKVLFEKK